MGEPKVKQSFWKNKYFKIAILVILTITVPYLTIPGLLIWLFQRNQKISKKVKTISYALVGVLLTVLLGYSLNTYSKDPEPSLEVISPQNNTEVQTDTIEIKGAYQPQDRAVWINGKKIQTENGRFSSSFTLQKGKNKIKIQAGNWKRATINLTVVRVPTADELAKQEAEKKIKEEKQAQDKQKKAEEESGKQAEKKAQEEQKAESNKPFAQKEVTEENIRQALVELKDISYSVLGENEITEIKIFDNAGTEDVADDKVVHIYFKPKSVLDEKDTLKKTVGTAVEVDKRLFSHPKITSVWVWVLGDFTDQYGKTSTDTATRVEISRQTADKIQWDNLKDMVLLDYNKLFNIADGKYIHPAILKKI